MSFSKLENAAPGSRSSLVNDAPGEVYDRLPALHLLVIDEDEEVQSFCNEISKTLHIAVTCVNSVAEAQAILARQSIDLLLLDLQLSDGDGLSVLEEVRARHPEIVIVVMTAYATVGSAVEAMRLGAADYLTKPFNMRELASTLERSVQRRSFDVQSRTLRERQRTGNGMGMLIGCSPAMEKLYRILSKVAFTSHPVLILGESGTGKELVARSIHANGPNAAKPFIPIDCGSLTPAQIESELFGHVKGAFAGAARSKVGLLAAADGGTVFLDEIAELPLDLQARLLRALQEKEIRPMGATQPTPISVRVLAATNRDLASMVENGRFRKDLYYRLNVVNIRIPPLRDRRSDVLLLAEHSLERLRSESSVPYTLAHDAARLLTAYNWPGNVRELEHSLERACALSSGPVLHTSDFPTLVQDNRPGMAIANHGDGTKEQSPQARYGVTSIAELEKQAILRTIRQLNGDKLTAARLLGIGKTTLYRKLKEYGVETRDGGPQFEIEALSDGE